VARTTDNRPSAGRRYPAEVKTDKFRISRAALLTGAVLLTACGTGDTPDTGTGVRATGGAPARGTGSPDGTSPLDNPDGTRPGLAPLTSPADTAEARTLITALTTKGRGPGTGYARDEFGSAWLDTADGVPFARNGCDTRIVSMLRAVVELFSQRMWSVVGCA
jgi:hypothetical protein